VVSAGTAGTTFVEDAKELPAWGVQKPPRRVGEKQFPGGGCQVWHPRPCTLEVAHGDDLSLLNLESEGAGSLAEDGLGAIVERMDRETTPPDPDETTTEEISWELAGQLAT
jgi:hypothetical protein